MSNKETSQCPKCQQSQKRLKIAKSDYEFELKKIQQDKSTEKAMYEIHLQKQVRRWQELYQKQKSQREDEGKNWMEKYDSTVKKYEAGMKRLQAQYQRQMSEKIDIITNESQDKIQKLVTESDRKLSETINGYLNEIKQIKQKCEEQVEGLRKENENYVANIKRSHKTFIQEKIKSYESKILGAQSQKSKQQKLHEETKIQSKEQQTKLYHQIYILRKRVSELQGACLGKDKQIESHLTTISSLYQQIENLKINHDTSVSQIEQKHRKEMKFLEISYKNQMTELYKSSLEHCTKYQSVILSIQEKRQSQKAIYRNNMEQINNFVENRNSKQEDIEQIQTLRDLLAKKSRECDLLSEQLRFFRLELENKQQTYNKIFVPITSSSNQQNIFKRKQFKLRRQGKSVTTVREALQSLNSANMAGDKKISSFLPPKPKIL